MDALHDLTLPALLAEHRRSHPQRTAVVCGDERFTWPELDDRVACLAGALASAGVAPRDRVLWLGQNCHRVLELLLACGRIGAIFCPVNWRQSSRELAFVIDDTDPGLIVWQADEIGAAVREARDLAVSEARWIQHDGGEYEDFLASGRRAGDAEGVDPWAPVLLIYTAAFDGSPNGALLTHAGIIAQNLVIMGVQSATADDVYLNSGPLFHIGTLWNTLVTFHVAGTNVFIRRVDAEEICRLIESERCTDAYILPPTRQQIDEVNATGRWDLRSLRSKAPSPWTRAPGGYGQTELIGMMTFKCIGGEAIGPHGRPHPLAQVRIVDEADAELPAGEVGEIVVRGPIVMAGYLGRDELTRDRHRNGWHHTNDLGRREADGSITFVGTKTVMIKSAAENIYPAEVEGCLVMHDAVREAAVIGVPDEKWTQSVKAIVVLHAGGDASEDDLIEHCRAHIASYKKPRTVDFVDALPRLASGAVDRDALDAMFGGGGYPGGTNRSA